ncbi:MAG: hypothetical protein HYX34_09720 [Actinobacteria bacterium]|nr:hypothetical protein [Actinomycetota bacterium]
MLKRTVWFTTGAAVGLGSSMWVQRRVKRAARRLLPEQVAAGVGTTVRRTVADVRAAAVEGRDAMRAREAELRAGMRDR